MKKILFAALMLISIKSMAIGTVKGNGVYKKETRSIETFTSLATSGQMNVEIEYGTSESLQVEGDENILPYIETFVKNGTLKIKVKDLTIIKPQLTLRVKVNMTTINGIAHSGSGAVSGSGAFKGDGTTAFSISGSGSIRLHFATFDNASVSLSGSGKLELKGTIAGNLEVHQSGSGRIDCENAPCERATVSISGSGSTRINVSESLNVHISGSGTIYYTGEAKKLDSHISGSGRLEKI